MEREAPRRRRESSETVVDPAGEPPLERRVAGMPRQHGLGRGQPREKELERAGPLRGPDWPDERRLPAAGRARPGRRGRDRGRAPSRPGRRRRQMPRRRGAQPRFAPERPPGSRRASRPRRRTTSRRRGRDADARAPRQPSGAPARRRAKIPRALSPSASAEGGDCASRSELADVDPPGRHLGARDLGASGQTDANLVVRERAGGIAGERERAGVLLPDELEGRRGRFRIRHDLSRVGARHDEPVDFAVVLLYDRPVVADQLSAQQLAEVPLFAGLKERQLKMLAQSLKARSFEPGATIAVGGQVGRRLLRDRRGRGDGDRRRPGARDASTPATTSASSR